jgi:molecular chaperone DnaK
MKKAIGIDLGTTYSVMAIVEKDRSIKIIKNSQNEELTRSAVGTFDDETIVGTEIYKYLKGKKSEDLIYSIKRIIGREFSDERVRELIYDEKRKVDYKIVQPAEGTEKSIAVILDGKEFSPEEISSEILRKLKKDAEEKLGKIDRAVITVPAYFNEKQRQATRKAGWMAGFKVQRILPEPTAAAVSYGVDKLDVGESKTLLVYDLGGGTFDLSLIQISGGSTVEINTDGDLWLGGDDFDKRIANYVIQETAQKYGIDNMEELIDEMPEEKRSKFLFNLKLQSEKAKIELSSLPGTEIEVSPSLMDKEGNDIDFDVQLTRAKFEEMIEEDINRTIEIVQRMMKEANYEPRDIDNVILVGGSSLIPLIKKKLAKVFDEEKILRHERPMLCVAEGAARVADLLLNLDTIECAACGKQTSAKDEKCSNCGEKLKTIKSPVIQLSNACGIEVQDNPFKEMIAKGEYAPIEKTHIYYTSVDDQRIIRIPAKSKDSEGKLLGLGTLWMTIPPDKKLPRGTEVEVTLGLDEDVVVGISARLLDGSGIQARFSRGAKDEKVWDDLTKVFEKAKDLGSEEKGKLVKKVQPVIESLNSDKVQDAKEKMDEILHEYPVEEATRGDKFEILIGFTEYILHRFHPLIEPEKTYELQPLIEDLKAAVAEGDLDTAERLYKELDKATDELPELIHLLDYIYRASWMIRERDPVKSEKLDNSVDELMDLAKAGDLQGFQKKVNEVRPQAEQIWREEGKGPPDKEVDPTLLSEMKRSY